MLKRLSLLLFLVSLTACEDEPELQFGEKKATPRGERGKKEAKEEEVKSDVPPPVDFQETAFTESERSRDPFRSFARAFIDEARGQVTSQREVILDQYSIATTSSRRSASSCLGLSTLLQRLIGRVQLL